MQQLKSAGKVVKRGFADSNQEKKWKLPVLESGHYSGKLEPSTTLFKDFLLRKNENCLHEVKKPMVVRSEQISFESKK